MTTLVEAVADALLERDIEHVYCAYHVVVPARDVPPQLLPAASVLG